MKEIIEKLLSESWVDRDIALFMLSESPNKRYKNWELLNDPCMTIISWQSARNKSANTTDKK